MIDLHTHIIYSVDDGAQSLKESMDLIDVSYHQGVRTIVATSHRRKGMFETPEDVILENFKQLQAIATEKYFDLTLYYGGELHYSLDVFDKIDKGLLPTLAETDYVLLEFSTVTPFNDMVHAVEKMRLIGKVPLIAHIERYEALDHRKDRVEKLIAKGAYTQINAQNVLKPKLFGDAYKQFKKRAAYFLKNRLVHVVASDMHNLEKRPPLLADAYREVSRLYGKECAKELFDINPKKIINNEWI